MRFMEKEKVKKAIKVARKLEEEEEPLPGKELEKTYQEGLHIARKLLKKLGLNWFIREKKHKHRCWEPKKLRRKIFK